MAFIQEEGVDLTPHLPLLAQDLGGHSASKSC